jgi:hypothetical protein
LIGGFIVGGPGSGKIVVRALGPSLATFGISHALQNPRLDLYDANGNIASNDDWATTTSGESIPAPLQPAHAQESALCLSLAPGQYTAIVRGKGTTTGVALVEVYNIQ